VTRITVSPVQHITPINMSDQHSLSVFKCTFCADSIDGGPQKNLAHLKEKHTDSLPDRSVMTATALGDWGLARCECNAVFTIKGLGKHEKNCLRSGNKRKSRDKDGGSSKTKRRRVEPQSLPQPTIVFPLGAPPVVTAPRGLPAFVPGVSDFCDVECALCQMPLLCREAETLECKHAFHSRCIANSEDFLSGECLSCVSGEHLQADPVRRSQIVIDEGKDDSGLFTGDAVPQSLIRIASHGRIPRTLPNGAARKLFGLLQHKSMRDFNGKCETHAGPSAIAESLERLYRLPDLVLSVGNRTHKQMAKDIRYRLGNKQVREEIGATFCDELGLFHQENREDEVPSFAKASIETDPLLSKVRRAMKCVRVGDPKSRRKAVQMLQSEGLKEFTPDVVHAFKQKFPPPNANAPIPPLPDSVLTCIVDEDTLKSVLKLNGGNVCPGPSGTTAQHRMCLMDDPIWWKDYCTFIQYIINGELPEPCRDILLAKTGLAGNKPLTDDPRPIGVQETDYKIARAYLNFGVTKPFAQKHLLPLQLAVGESAGVEKAVGRMVAALQASEVDSDIVVLKVDVKNAFNELSRARLLDLYMKHPELAPLLPFLHWTYRSPSHVLLRKPDNDIVSVLSQDGLNQGDLGGSFDFSATVHEPMVTAIRTAVAKEGNCQISQQGPDHMPMKGVVAAAITDDLTLALPLKIAIEFLKVLGPELERVNLKVNLHKTQLLWIHDRPIDPISQSELDDMKVIVKTTFIVFGGIPVCKSYNEQFVIDFLQEKIRSYKDLFDGLGHEAMHPQIGSILLRESAQLVSSHILRCIPPQATEDYAYNLDVLIKDCVCKHMRLSGWADLSRNTQVQIELPLREGGGGIKSQSDLRSIAFYAASATIAKDQVLVFGPGSKPSSVIETLDLCEADMLTQGIPQESIRPTDKCFYTHFLNPNTSTHKFQHILTTERDKRKRERLVNNSKLKIDKVRLDSCKGPGASAWLLVLPDRYETSLSPAEYRIASRIRFGIDPIETGPICCPRKGCASIDQGKDKLHPLVCRFSRSTHRSSQHDSIGQVMGAVFRRHSCNVSIEPQLPNGKNVGDRCDLRVTLGQKQWYIDNTVVQVQCKTALSRKNGKYVEDRIKAKRDHYEQAVEALGAKFGVFAVESFGGWTGEAYGIMRSIVGEIINQVGLSSSEVHSLHYDLYSHISVAVQRGQARTILREYQHSVRSIAGQGRWWRSDVVVG
jgi:hypothetical protein